jgi:hypothetical protein
MRRTCAVVVVALLAADLPARAEDTRLEGAWKGVTYRIAGRDYPMEGIFIFTPKYFSSNVLFKLTNGPADDANANGGPYTADGKQIVFTQWVQIHLRPGDRKEPIFSMKGAPETASYEVNGDRLVITFPSKNRYVLQRLRE